jgi:uncharacterized membrane protein
LLVALFDGLSAVAGDSDPTARELYRAGTFILTATVALLVISVATGIVDRARADLTDSNVRARVYLHIALMSTMAGAIVCGVALRYYVYDDALRTPGVVLAVTLAALVASLLGADVGGRLTYRLGLGVRPRPRGEA